MSDINKPCVLCGSETAAKRIKELEAEVERLLEALEQIYGITACMAVSERIVRIHTIAAKALEEAPPTRQSKDLPEYDA